MNYIEQINAFYTMLDYNALSTNAIALYNYLLHIAYTLDCINEFSVANTTLMSKLRLTIKELQNARNELINKKYISYKKGRNQNIAPKYQIINNNQFTNIEKGQPQRQAQGQAESKAEGQADGTPEGYIITILYLLFNYINNRENENFFKDISESQRQGIRLLLKKFNVLIESPNTIQYLDEQRILKAQIQYYVVKELYFSPYKVILEKLTKEEFNLKFLKTEKYVDLQNESINKFINYFTKTLKEKVDRGFNANENNN